MSFHLLLLLPHDAARTTTIVAAVHDSPPSLAAATTACCLSLLLARTTPATERRASANSDCRVPVAAAHAECGQYYLYLTSRRISRTAAARRRISGALHPQPQPQRPTQHSG